MCISVPKEQILYQKTKIFSKYLAIFLNFALNTENKQNKKDKMIMKDKYELVIGLEVHAQLQTASKAYFSEENTYGSMPNTNISVLTLAHPGTLPKANKTSFDYAIKMGLALGSQITEETIFARKNYFYPDLPKGYQITQDKTPICVGGNVIINLKDNQITSENPEGKTINKEHSIRLTRIHLEEDAGKSLHIDGEEESFIDLNRAGVPLIEIVSEPDIRNADEAHAYLTEIRKLVRYLDVCDGNMEEGSLRCDVNISVRLIGAKELGTRAEIKNLNSFSNVKRAIEYEFERQTALVEQGITFGQETRMFDATTGTTTSLRMKEAMNDYRYFPEPDLTPVIVDKTWIERIRKLMPALPRALFLKFTKEYHLSDYDAEVITAEKETAMYFEEMCKITKNYKSACNWLTGNIKGYLNERTLALNQFPVSAKNMAEMVNLIDAGKINHNIAAKQIYPKMLLSPDKSAEMIATEDNLLLSTNLADNAAFNLEIEGFISEIMANFPAKVAEYKAGKTGLLGMFVGEVMKKTKGKANPKTVNELVVKLLDLA